MPQEPNKPKVPNSTVIQTVSIQPAPIKSVSANTEFGTAQVLPEQMSLVAHQHIQNYLSKYRKYRLDKNDLNSILRLSTHLRVFGLLSAVGYLNQSNAQAGEVRERTVPVWESLLGQMLDENNPLERQQMMTTVVEMAGNQPKQYMATWRRSLMLANHWNFWARSYQEEE